MTSTLDVAEREGTPGDAAIVRTLVRRELTTAVLRAPYLGLGVALFATVLGIVLAGGGLSVGYVSVVVDLLMPIQLLVPVVAMAFGYRAILDDHRRGELDVLKTYPVSAWQVVIGVYVGRAIGLVAVVVVSLLAVMVPVAATDPVRSIFYATHSGADSPLLYLRFVVLSVGFALAILAIALAISALATSTRTALAAVAVSLFVLLFGLDLALVFGLANGLVGESSLVHSLAFSPLGAFRGLVLETTVAATSGTGPRAAAPLSSLVGLLAWSVGSLGAATWGVRT